MPKEQINFDQPVRMHHGCAPEDIEGDAACACTPTVDTMPSVYVRWGAGGHDKLDIGNVQLMLAVREQPAWDEWVKADPWAGPSAFPAPPVKEEIHSAVLSRSEINKLIQVLKRARDQAYGKDE